MVGAGMGEALGRAMLGFAAICFVIGGALVAFVAWGIPWLWQIAKPWLHAITG